MLSSGQANRTAIEKANELFGRLAGDALGIVTDKRIGDETAGGGLEEGLVRLLLDLRAEMRKAKNFPAADRIREGLSQLGVDLKDGPEGTSWKRI